MGVASAEPNAFELDPNAPNVIPVKYRQVALATVDCELAQGPLQDHFIGREAYMTTRFIVVKKGDDVAFVEVAKSPTSELFADIVALRLLAGPDDCVYVTDRDADVGIPSVLARVASSQPGATCVVVEGLYSHVSFILNPAPLDVLVLDIVPPVPSKLLDQAERVLSVGEDLPPIVLSSSTIDSRALLEDAASTSERVLLPCRATGVEFGETAVSFLDERPEKADWTILGCERTRQIHQWFYDAEAESVDTCPKQFLASGGGEALLTRCCMLQEGMEQQGQTTIVPWGSTLAEVRAGLESVVRSADFAWTPV